LIEESASFLAFPLRLQDGFLRRTDAAEAVVTLLQIMVDTSRGKWKGSERFGMREYFEQARTQPALIEVAIPEMNAALEDLGITHIQVQNITRETPGELDTDNYTVTLSTAGQSFRKSLSFQS
jgi:hypothetical protein